MVSPRRGGVLGGRASCGLFVLRSLLIAGLEHFAPGRCRHSASETPKTSTTPSGQSSTAARLEFIRPRRASTSTPTNERPSHPVGQDLPELPVVPDRSTDEAAAGPSATSQLPRVHRPVVRHVEYRRSVSSMSSGPIIAVYAPCGHGRPLGRAGVLLRRPIGRARSRCERPPDAPEGQRQDDVGALTVLRWLCLTDIDRRAGDERRRRSRRRRGGHVRDGARHAAYSSGCAGYPNAGRCGARRAGALPRRPR